MRSLFFILTMTVIYLSCKTGNINAEETVEIYLLKTYKTVAAKCQIDSSFSVLQDTATIKNKDILEYSKRDYQFKLTDIAIQKVKAFRNKMPFAVTVNKQVIYYGFFKPSISSSSCDHSITLDIDRTSGNKILLRLGYPEQLQSVTIEDRRNNPKLIAALKKQGKLR